MIKVEIVIPCYNEEKNLERLWIECLAVVKESGASIAFIILDNGSSDNSSQFMTSHSGLNRNIRFVSVQPNKGYGGGIIAGLQESSAPYVGWTHADLQTPLSDCVLALEFLESGYEFVKGSRTGRPLSDQFFSLGMGFITSLLFQKRLQEVNAQPTLMERSIYVSWSDLPNDFSLDLYALVMAKTVNLKIARFEVNFLKRLEGESKWNSGFASRYKFIIRTIKYSLQLRKRMI
jgi:glycosyltransferase involved in cell wall biosynthesis